MGAVNAEGQYMHVIWVPDRLVDTSDPCLLQRLTKASVLAFGNIATIDEYNRV
jgi:hypothetical protein